MWLQCLPPRMQDAEKPDLHTEAVRVGAGFEHGSSAGFKQEMKESPLVLPDERYQIMWNAEHDVECMVRRCFASEI